MYDENPCIKVTEKRVIARKDHRCTETGQIIHKGQSYWRVNGLWEEGPDTFHLSEFGMFTHRVLRQILSTQEWPAYGEAMDRIVDYLGDYGGVLDAVEAIDLMAFEDRKVVAPDIDFR